MSATAPAQPATTPVHRPTRYENPYRDLATRDLETKGEAWRWLAAECATDPDLDHPGQTRAYVALQVQLIDEEIARRQRLRHHPLAPAWPERRVDVDAVRERVDLAALIERDAAVRFVAAGAQLKGSCPFPDHADPDPSFFVHPGKRLWICRGCGRGGDAFTFVMDWLGVTFKTALGLLAREAGVEPLPSARPSRARMGVGRVG